MSMYRTVGIFYGGDNRFRFLSRSPFIFLEKRISIVLLLKQPKKKIATQKKWNPNLVLNKKKTTHYIKKSKEVSSKKLPFIQNALRYWEKEIRYFWDAEKFFLPDLMWFGTMTEETYNWRLKRKRYIKPLKGYIFDTTSWNAI